MDSKRILRENKKKVRDSIPDFLRKQYDRQITKRILENPFYKDTKILYCYVNFRSEVSTQEILRAALAEGKIAAVPKVEHGQMQFYKIRENSSWYFGAYGILEPESEETIAEPGFMLLPGLSFDLQGRRLGYGGGYYDRYLAAHPMNYKMAICYSSQLTNNVPVDACDQKVDGIITELQWLTC